MVTVTYNRERFGEISAQLALPCFRSWASCFVFQEINCETLQARMMASVHLDGELATVVGIMVQMGNDAWSSGWEVAAARGWYVYGDLTRNAGFGLAVACR
jgi:hypothetical protein